MRQSTPSHTAYKVALNIITLDAKPGMDQVIPGGVVAATAELLVKSGTASQRLVRWAKSQRMVSVYEAFDWMLPGQFEAFGYRKAFFEQQVRRTIEEGTTQVLVLGAGYDTLGWRLAQEYGEGIQFFEIDHPATSAIKATRIREMGQPDNLHLIAEDLGRKELSAVLETNDYWDQSVKSIFIAEGLVMYLTAEAVCDLFCHCASISGQDSCVGFSYIPKGSDGRPDAGPWTGLMLWLQKMAGEPLLWSIVPDQLVSFLRETGWVVLPESADTDHKYGVEYFAIARKLKPKASQ